MSSRPRRAATLNVKYNDNDAGGYPDGKPDTPFEKMVSLLNNQAFPSARLAHVDDLVVYAMFASKARPQGYRAIKPDTISGASMTAEEGGLFNHCVGQHVTNSNPTFPECQEAAKEIMAKAPQHFDENTYKVLVHLILRYKLMYSAESNIGLEKVVFGDGPISGGLRARTTIRAGAYLLYRRQQQLGPTGSRLILGPLRFVNHDCNPNSQLYPIPNSHAFTIITLKEIEAGQSISVKYTEGGYWGDCWCGSCKGYSTLMPLRRSPVPQQPPNPNKKTRRGGKRKTVSINGVHTRILSNAGNLKIAPEHVPSLFVLPARKDVVTSSEASAPVASTSSSAQEPVPTDMPSPMSPIGEEEPPEPTEMIYDMPSPMSSIDSDSD